MNLIKLTKIIIKICLITLFFFSIIFLVFRFAGFVLSFFNAYDDLMAAELTILAIPAIFFILWFIVKKTNLPIKKELTALQEEVNKINTGPSWWKDTDLYYTWKVIIGEKPDETKMRIIFIILIIYTAGLFAMDYLVDITRQGYWYSAESFIAWTSLCVIALILAYYLIVKK